MGFKRDDDNGVLTVNLPADLIERVSLAASMIDPKRPRKSTVVEMALKDYLEDYFGSERSVTEPARKRRAQLSA